MQAKLSILLLFLTGPLFAQLTLKVTQVPANTPMTDNIHVAGSFQGWDPASSAHILTNNGDGTYQITVTPPVGLVEFKFTRGGSWATVEGDANGGEISNRTFNYTGSPATVTAQVLSWKDLTNGGGNSTASPNVFLLDNDFYMPQLDRNRRILIYLPPDYNSSDKHYPVLYMHDGQNLFDAATSFSGEWEVDESLDQLHAQGDHGCIVVAIDNGGALRIDELAPWVNTNYNEGGEGGAYVDFIVETLKPYVDANFRTYPGREYTGLMGSSLGGLITQYGVVEHQNVFGKAGVFSPAFWFNDPSIFQHSANTDKTGDVKIYFLAAYPEDNGSVVDDVNQMESVLLNNGYESQELKKLFHQDGAHSEWYWAREFPAAYEWLFGGLTFPSSTTEVPSGKFRVYPNPVDSVLFFENLPPAKKPQYVVYSMDGRVAAKGKLIGNSLDVSKLADGAYVLSIYNNKRKLVASERFLVRN